MEVFFWGGGDYEDFNQFLEIIQERMTQLSCQTSQYEYTQPSLMSKIIKIIG